MIKTLLLEETDLLLLCIFIILISLPPFHIAAVSFNILAKIVISLAFFKIIWQSTRDHSKIREIYKHHAFLLAFFISLFILQSLSIINSKNLNAFIVSYQNILFGGVFLFVASAVLTKKSDIEKILQLLLIAQIINLLFELIIYINPIVFRNIFANLIDVNVVNAINYNFSRGRIYYESFSQVFIPVIAYFLFIKKALVRQKIWRYLVFGLMTLLIIFNSLVSNNRTFFLMLFFGSVGSMLILLRSFRRINLLRFFSIILLCIVLSLFALRFSRYTTGFDIVERVALTDTYEDVNTLSSRVDLWKLAAQIGLLHPLLGVGLGNFLEYIPVSYYIDSFLYNSVSRRGIGPVFQSPHNILFSTFAETGGIALIVLIILVSWFVISDIKYFRSKHSSNLTMLVIVSFWTLFTFAFFNPTNSIRFYTYFWFFRVLIAKEEVRS